MPDRVRAVLSDVWSKLERILPATVTRLVREHRRVALAVGILMLLMLVGACVQAAKPRPKPKVASTATTTADADEEIVEAALDEQNADTPSDEPEPEPEDDAEEPTPDSDTDDEPKDDQPDPPKTTTPTQPRQTSNTPVSRPAPQASLSVSRPSADGNSGWYVHVPILTLTSNTDGKIWYRWDSGAWAVYAQRISAPSGTHKLSYYAKDARGKSQAVQAKTFKVDVTAPSVPVRIRLVAVDTRSVTIAWNASSDRISGVRRYNIYDSRGVIVGDSRSTRFTLSGLLPGQRVALSVQAEDLAGNRSAHAAGLTASALMPDTTPPKTTLSLSPKTPDGGDGWYVTTPTVTLKRSEAGRTSWWWDSGTRSTYSAPFKAVEGKHSLHYRSTDTAGNRETTRSAEIRLDTIAPGTPALSSTITTTTVTLAWPAVTDEGSGVGRYDLYESSGASVIATFSPSGSMTATYAVGANAGYFLRVADRAGNVSQASATVSGTAQAQRRGGGRRVLTTAAAQRATAGTPLTTAAAPRRMVRITAESGGGGGAGSEAQVSQVPAGSPWSMALLAVLGAGLLAFETRKRTA